VDEVMDEAAKADPKHKSVLAFQGVRDAIKRPVKADDPAIAWKDRLGDFKSTRSDHYTLLYDVPSDAEAERRAKRLEDNFKGFFYWFALRGNAVPVPDRRLVAVLVQSKRAFEQKHRDIFPEVPVAADGFYDRRDNLAVFSSEQLDPAAEALKKRVDFLMQNPRWSPDALLHGKGLPRAAGVAQVYEWTVAQTVMLLHTASEEQAEQTSVTHEGTRQLIAAAGLLPRAVEAPRWVDFGTASFFEAPKVALWPGVGAPNLPYLFNFKKWDEEKSKKLPREPAEALKGVVTDHYFHAAARDGKKRPGDLARAETLSWALTYFLAKKKRDGLLRYFDELRTLPRDLAFDEDVLLGVFARAFRLADEAKPDQVDQSRLTNFANEWYQFMRTSSGPEVVELYRREKATAGAPAAAR
jgi:hypothetical protein